MWVWSNDHKWHTTKWKHGITFRQNYLIFFFYHNKYMVSVLEWFFTIKPIKQPHVWWSTLSYLATHLLLNTYILITLSNKAWTKWVTLNVNDLGLFMQNCFKVLQTLVPKSRKLSAAVFYVDKTICGSLGSQENCEKLWETMGNGKNDQNLLFIFLFQYLKETHSPSYKINAQVKSCCSEGQNKCKILNKIGWI